LCLLLERRGGEGEEMGFFHFRKQHGAFFLMMKKYRKGKGGKANRILEGVGPQKKHPFTGKKKKRPSREVLRKSCEKKGKNILPSGKTVSLSK